MSAWTPGPWTPGPWAIKTNAKGERWKQDKRNGGEYLEVGSSTVWVADVRQSSANARLIAAAPEMAEMLRRLLEPGRDIRRFPDAYRDGRALLARIEGDET